MTSKEIEQYNNLRLQKQKEITTNRAYVGGKNPVTLAEAPQKKPDNRITIPLAKIAVDTVHGYSGRAGDMQLEYETVDINSKDVDSAYLDIQKQIAEHNEEPIETSELYHDALVYGYSYELLWISDDLNLQGIMTPEYKKIPVSEIHINWSTDLKPKKLSVIRFQKFGNTETVDIYYPYYSERWEKTEKSSQWARNKDFDTKYPYSEPPLVIYGLNEKQVSLFEAEKGLIDANDKILNRTVNEIDRFNALIFLMPGRITKEVKDKLLDIGVIDDLSQFDKYPEYLQKDLSGVNDLYSGAIKYIKDLFFQSVSVPDFSDKDFMNAQSGVAMAYKLIGLEFLASKIDTYFIRGLKERHKLINDVIRESNKYNPDDFKLVVKTNRNLPVDTLNAAEIATKLQGLVSKETLIKMLPKSIIEDSEVEMQRIKDEEDNIDLDKVEL